MPASSTRCGSDGTAGAPGAAAVHAATTPPRAPGPCMFVRGATAPRAMYWIIQDSLTGEAGFPPLIAALEQRGLPFSLHKVVPFSGELVPEPAPVEGGVIVMGSYGLALAAARRGWRPGAWLENLDFAIQRAHWGAAMLNHDAEVVPLGEITERSEPFFLRPVNDTKSFAGRLYDWPAFLEWRHRLSKLSPDDQPTVWLDTEVMVCSKKEIWSETRTWIVDRRVVTASRYKVGDTVRSTPPELVDERVLECAAAHAEAWSPDRAYVLDIAETPDGLKIIEVNNINSAGWYKADMSKLVAALEGMP